MNNILEGTHEMFLIVAIVSLIVLVAMAVDLVSGIRKAKLRGEARTSYGLSRSLTKFLLYEGGIIIAACIDTLIHLANLWTLFNLDIMDGIPVVCCIIGIFLCGIEGWSVFEKADEKDKSKIKEAGAFVGSVIEKDKVIDTILDVLAERLKERRGEEC